MCHSRIHLRVQPSVLLEIYICIMQNSACTATLKSEVERLQIPIDTGTYSCYERMHTDRD